MAERAIESGDQVTLRNPMLVDAVKGDFAFFDDGSVIRLSALVRTEEVLFYTNEETKHMPPIFPPEPGYLTDGGPGTPAAEGRG